MPSSLFTKEEMALLKKEKAKADAAAPGDGQPGTTAKKKKKRTGMYGKTELGDEYLTFAETTMDKERQRAGKALFRPSVRHKLNCFKVEPGSVSLQIQRSTTATITFKELTKKEKLAVTEKIRDNQILRGDILLGKLSPGLLQAVELAKVKPLHLPFDDKDIAVTCTCSRKEWSKKLRSYQEVPESTICAHGACLHYNISQECDRDPLFFFKARGLDLVQWTQQGLLVDEVGDLKVEDLRHQLAIRGLDQTGVKAELVTRLTEFLAAPAAGGPGEAELRYPLFCTPLIDSSFTVAKLREVLKEKHLPAAGTKAELLDRLAAAGLQLEAGLHPDSPVDASQPDDAEMREPGAEAEGDGIPKIPLDKLSTPVPQILQGLKDNPAWCEKLNFKKDALAGMEADRGFYAALRSDKLDSTFEAPHLDDNLFGLLELLTNSAITLTVNDASWFAHATPEGREKKKTYSWQKYYGNETKQEEDATPQVLDYYGQVKIVHETFASGTAASAKAMMAGCPHVWVPGNKLEPDVPGGHVEVKPMDLLRTMLALPLEEAPKGPATTFAFWWFASKVAKNVLKAGAVIPDVLPLRDEQWIGIWKTFTACEGLGPALKGLELLHERAPCVTKSDVRLKLKAREIYAVGADGNWLKDEKGASIYTVKTTYKKKVGSDPAPQSVIDALPRETVPKAWYPPPTEAQKQAKMKGDSYAKREYQRAQAAPKESYYGRRIEGTNTYEEFYKKNYSHNFRQQEDYSKYPQCAHCHSHIRGQEKVTLPCGCKFHKYCIVAKLATNRKCPSCDKPVCATTLKPEATTKLDSKSTVLHVLSVLVTNTVQTMAFMHKKQKKKPPKESKAIFKGVPFQADPKNAAQQTIGPLAQRYFQAFKLLDLDLECRLRVYKKRDEHAQLGAEDNEAVEDYASGVEVNHFAALEFSKSRKDAMVPLNVFLKKHPEETNTILKVLASVFEFLPQVQVLTHEDTALLDHDTIAKCMRSGFAMLAALGCKMVLPKEMMNFCRPRLVLVPSNEWKTEANFKLEDMKDFKYMIALGNDLVPVEEFKKMCGRQSKIIEHKEQYFEIDQANVKLLFKEAAKDPPTGFGLLREAMAEDSNVMLNKHKSNQEIIKHILKHRDVHVPSTLTGTLREYQLSGFKWLASQSENGFGCLLADDMGLGKTVQTLTLLLHLREQGKINPDTGTGPALVVVPLAVLKNWQLEAKKFSPCLASRLAVYHGPSRKKALEDLEAKGTNIVLTTYGTMVSAAETLKKQTWGAIVIDEAQKIKNKATHAWKAATAIEAPIRVGLSGTPVENHLGELWAIFHFVIPGFLGSLREFKSKFGRPIEIDGDKEMAAKLKKVTAPFMLRRLKTDKAIAPTLPDKTTYTLQAPLVLEQAAMYNEVKNDFFRRLMEMKAYKPFPALRYRQTFNEMLLRLKQVCNHPNNYSRGHEGSSPDEKPNLSGKCNLLSEKLNEIIEGGEKVIIFTQFVEMLKILQKYIPANHKVGGLPLEPLIYHGAMSIPQREAAKDKFQAGTCPVILVSLKAGGVGLNLTAANHVIHYDLWWNPAVENQATDRAFRIGQTKNVFVHRFVAKGTLEERIDAVLKKKGDLSNLTVAEGQKWLADMSERHLDALLNGGDSWDLLMGDDTAGEGGAEDGPAGLAEEFEFEMQQDAGGAAQDAEGDAASDDEPAQEPPLKRVKIEPKTEPKTEGADPQAGGSAPMDVAGSPAEEPKPGLVAHIGGMVAGLGRFVSGTLAAPGGPPGVAPPPAAPMDVDEAAEEAEAEEPGEEPAGRPRRRSAQAMDYAAMLGSDGEASDGDEEFQAGSDQDAEDGADDDGAVEVSDSQEF